MGEQRLRLLALEPRTLENAWETGQRVRIGRSDSAAVLLRDPSISRNHAEIEPTRLGWVVRDLGSRNGTFLNGTPVGRPGRLLRERDLLQCGNVVLIVDSLGATDADAEESLGSLKLQAVARQSLEQAAEVLALDVTRSSRPAEQLLSLLRVGQGTDQFDSLADFLCQSIRDTAHALQARQGAIALLDPHSQKLNVRAVFQPLVGLSGGNPFSHTLAQRCLREGQSLLCADVFGDAELRNAPSVNGKAPGSVICALLRSPRRRLGVLHLDRAFGAEPFTSEDLHRADALAIHLSAFIDNAASLEEKQHLLFIQTLIAFSQVIELRDEYTAGHTQRVTEYSLLLAEELYLSEPERYALRIGAPLHDVGKVVIDDNVLRKPDRLTLAEFEHMKTHTVKGAAILQPFPGLTDVIPVVRNHHERWDGTGYPDRLAGEAIPRLARLVAVADTFDAMTSDRPYRKGLPVDQAFDQIQSAAGVQFDPECAAAFLRVRRRVEECHRQHIRPDSAQGVGVLPAVFDSPVYV
jgi:HD-GYP domain-containing protein (c-di-GMP phosphodiesterase class II)